ncbi:MAG: formate dehydrogenase subunit gamma [Pararhodobacter sp.]|nr:formate dehydrogenase subunit gamma [Pararhodobacter sp.]
MRQTLSRLVAASGLAAAGAGTALAQVNPTASSVNEEALLRALQSGEAVSGRASIPNPEASALIAPDNQLWATMQGSTLQTLSIVAVLGTLALLVLFYLIRGRIRIEGGWSGRKILRFNSVERFAHWLLATTFIILALTGLNLIIGRTVILPLVGEGAFGTLTAWGKIAHNYLAWPFMAALIMVFVLWVIHNIPAKIDLEWIKQGGGIFKKGVHPPARKFNFGQKIVFWAVILGGAAMSYTGIMLLFPADVGSAADWQFYQVIHALVAAAMSVLILGHIYIGTVGMEGAFDAMGTGEVDENWAKEHHSLWVDEVKGTQARNDAQIKPAE